MFAQTHQRFIICAMFILLSAQTIPFVGWNLARFTILFYYLYEHCCLCDCNLRILWSKQWRSLFGLNVTMNMKNDQQNVVVACIRIICWLDSLKTWRWRKRKTIQPSADDDDASRQQASRLNCFVSTSIKPFTSNSWLPFKISFI